MNLEYYTRGNGAKEKARKITQGIEKVTRITMFTVIIG